MDAAYRRGPRDSKGNESQKAAEEKQLQAKGATAFLILKTTIENTGAQYARFDVSGFSARDTSGNPLSRTSSGSLSNEMKAQGSRDAVGGFGPEEQLEPGQPRALWLMYAAREDDSPTLVYSLPGARAPEGATAPGGLRAEWDIGTVGSLPGV